MLNINFLGVVEQTHYFSAERYPAPMNVLDMIGQGDPLGIVQVV